jgi:ATP-binding cassette subfamily C (CFTR/MRP) protein 1
VSDPALAKGENPRDLVKGLGNKKEKEAEKKKAKEAKKEQKAQEKREKKAKKDGNGSGEGTSGEPSPGATVIQDSTDDGVFKLRNVDMKIHKGQFVALVGRIGSGKSSCFNAIIGEMRKTRGAVCSFLCEKFSWLTKFNRFRSMDL